MKEFKNIPSKLYEKTENWIAKEKNLTKAKYPNNFNESKPKPRRIMSASAAHSHRNNIQSQPGYTPINVENYLNNNNKKENSMFENYYHDKMVSKKLIPSQEEEKAQQLKDDLDYQFQSHLRELRSLNNIESQFNEQYETIKKAQLKANTPGINDKGVILPKNNNKNYVEENKQKIKKGELPKKNNSNNNINNKSNEQNPYHKDFGKTPQYLKNMKLEAEKKKELDNLRVSTLNKLMESKKEIENLIGKLPIALKSQASKNKQEELYKKIDEIDKAIETFSRKKVFVKIDS